MGATFYKWRPLPSRHRSLIAPTGNARLGVTRENVPPKFSFLAANLGEPTKIDCLSEPTAGGARALPRREKSADDRQKEMTVSRKRSNNTIEVFSRKPQEERLWKKKQLFGRGGREGKKKSGTGDPGGFHSSVLAYQRSSKSERRVC